jgi:transglutaminase-like putative cysteine protease
MSTFWQYPHLHSSRETQSHTITLDIAGQHFHVCTTSLSQLDTTTWIPSQSSDQQYNNIAQSTTNSLDIATRTITLTPDTIAQLWSWDPLIAARLYYYRTISQLMASRNYESHLINSVLLSKDPLAQEHVLWLDITPDASRYSVYFQAFFASLYAPQCVSWEVRELLDRSLPLRDGQTTTLASIITAIWSSLAAHDLIASYLTALATSTNTTDSSATPSSLTSPSTAGSQQHLPYLATLTTLYRTGAMHGIRDALRLLEKQRIWLSDARSLQEQHKQNLSKPDPQDPAAPTIQQDTASTKRDTYTPQDSIRQQAEEWPRTVKDSREAPLTGYIKTNSMQTFNPISLQRSASDQTSQPFSPDYTQSATHTHTIQAASPWRYEYNIPTGFQPLSIHGDASLSVNQSGDYTLQVSSPWEIQVRCAMLPAPLDTYDYSSPLCSAIPSQVQEFLGGYTTPAQKLDAIKQYILTKTYATNYQGTIVVQSAGQDDYISRLWDAPKLECYSANHLFVALARQLWYTAKLSVGYHTWFVHEWKSYITSNDGHARSEILIRGQRHIVDVTPTMPDPSDPQQSDASWEGQTDHELPSAETTQTHTPSPCMLDTDLTPIEKKSLQQQYIDDTHNAPYEVKTLIEEWISVDAARDFYDRMQRMLPRAEAMTHRLKKIFEDEKTITHTSYSHTTRPQTAMDLQKILTEQPAALTWDVEAIMKLRQTPYYLQKNTYQTIQKQYPDEIRLTTAIDVSGSMKYNRETSKDYIVLLRLTFAQLYAVMQQHGTRVRMDCYGFATHSHKYALSPDDDMMTLDMSPQTMAWLARIFAKIPDGMQEECGGGNAENNFYKDLIYERAAQNISGGDTRAHEKKIVRLGISCTDQETLSDTSDNDEKPLVLPDHSILPWSDKHTRLSDLLYYLQHTLHLPMVALNTSGGWAVVDSGYAHYISADESMDAHMADLLESLLKPTIIDDSKNDNNDNNNDAIP